MYCSGGGAETSFSMASSEVDNAKETLFEAMRSGSLAQVEHASSESFLVCNLICFDRS